MPNSSYFWSKSIYFFWYTDRLNEVVFIARQWIDLRHTVVGWLQIIIHSFTFGRLLSTHRPTRPSSSLWFRLMWFLALVFFFSSKSNPILSIVPNYLVALNGKTRVRVFQNLFYEKRRAFEMDGRMKAKKKKRKRDHDGMSEEHRRNEQNTMCRG